jgi:hypothetical protein
MFLRSPSPSLILSLHSAISYLPPPNGRKNPDKVISVTELWAKPIIFCAV